MTQTLLFIIFVGIAIFAIKLIWKRTGNYDVDYITKLIGWVLLIPATWGILESLRLL